MKTIDLSPAPMAPDTSPQEVVDAITAAARSSFAIGMKLLAKPRRAAMRAVYAFCRVVDDIADGDLPVADKCHLLEAWRGEIDHLFAGAPVSAIGRALAGPVETHDLPREEFHRMIDGMEMDANGPIIAPSHEELTAYNRCVAGTVGMLSMRVFGAWRGEPSERFALALANALQTTNILRDVEEDAAIGRIYLPAPCLEKAGIPARPELIAAHPGLPVARACLAQVAVASFAEARSLIPAHDRRALAPALAMYGVYRAYYDRMAAAGWIHGPASRMGPLSKLRYGLAAVFCERGT